MPTSRAVALLALGLLPAVLAVLGPTLAWAALFLDLLVLALVLVDYLRAPSPQHLKVTRVVAPVLSSGATNLVRLELEQHPLARSQCRGELRDTVDPGPALVGHRQRLGFSGRTTLTLQLTPRTRGDLSFGDVWVRLTGPWGLCARQFAISATQRVKVFPNLVALTRDAVTWTRASEDSSRRVERRPAEGREFESLREFRPGDDRRALDWKATARRARLMVRQHQPERNQQVLLLLDCGRHMAGEVDGRRKLDHAVDAALRLAKVSLDQGDTVGVLAFAASVTSHLPPRKGAEQLRAITHALYRAEAVLTESDYGAALDAAFARGVRRSLVIVLTDLLDAESSLSLVKRLVRLVPRHLPLVASLKDDEVHRVSVAVPRDRSGAFERLVARRLEAEVLRSVARLRDAGALVLRARAQDFGPRAVSAYLEVKARGLL